MNVVVAHHEELSSCEALGAKEGDLLLAWSVSAAGVPFGVAPLTAGYADDPATRCIVKAISGWKFPQRAKPTLDIDLPIRFQR